MSKKQELDTKKYIAIFLASLIVAGGATGLQAYTNRSQVPELGKSSIVEYIDGREKLGFEYAKLSNQEKNNLLDFEKAMKTYSRLYINPDGLSYVDKQALEKAKETIKDNIPLLSRIYLSEIKSKAAEAFNLPESEMDKFEATSYDTSTEIMYHPEDGSDKKIPTQTTDLDSYVHEFLGDKLFAHINKDFKKSVKNVVSLQFMSKGTIPYDAESVKECYDDYLKFISKTYVANDKGAIVLYSELKHTPEDVLESYIPTFVSLSARKSEQGGHLKKSQSMDLNQVKTQIYHSLLELIPDMAADYEAKIFLNDREQYNNNPEEYKQYKERFNLMYNNMNKSSEISDEKLVELIKLYDELHEKLHSDDLNQLEVSDTELEER